MTEPKQIDFSTMTKKKTKKGIKKAGASSEEADERYREMLARIFSLRKDKNGCMADNDKKIILKQPEVQRLGTTKTAWINFIDIAEMLCRPPDHIYKYFFNELATDGSTSGSQLILKGRFNENNIEFILKKYITEYVKCRMCRSMQTVLTKDPSIRMFMMVCEKCGCTRSVQQVQEAYRAFTKGERKKQRQ